MDENNDRLSSNPFVQTLRGGAEEENREQVTSQNGTGSEIAAATMEAMSMGDREVGAGDSGSGSTDGVVAPAESAPAASHRGRLDAVVDLLFGDHLNGINASLRALEEQLSKRICQVENEMGARLEANDRHTKEVIDLLNDAIEKERVTRDDAVAKIGDRVDAAMGQIEMRLEKMETEFARRGEILQKDLDERLTEAADASMLLREGMEQEIADMKVSLSTRTELGGMFAELGKRLEANANDGGPG